MSGETRVGHVGIRHDEDRSVDEVFVHDCEGRLLLHMERMDGDSYWMRLTTGGQEDVVINMVATIGPEGGPVIHVTDGRDTA